MFPARMNWNGVDHDSASFYFIVFHIIRFAKVGFFYSSIKWFTSYYSKEIARIHNLPDKTWQ